MHKLCYSTKPHLSHLFISILITLFLAGCDGNLIQPNENYAPVADAGEDQNSLSGTVVKLDASDSFDKEGKPLSYYWKMIEKPKGSKVQLNGTNFVPDRDGKYVFQLIVNNGKTDSKPDTVTIIAGTNTKPIANAGDDQKVKTGDLVVLDGSRSSDPENHTISYQWSFIEKPDESLSILDTPNKATTHFTPDIGGIYRVALKTNDGTLDSEIDSVKIIVIGTDSGTPIQKCTPNSTESESCAVSNGSGTQARACSADGTIWEAYNNCTVTSCKTGYVKKGNTCVLIVATPPNQICTPNSAESKNCTITNGTGTQTRACSANGKT